MIRVHRNSYFPISYESIFYSLSYIRIGKSWDDFYMILSLSLHDRGYTFGSYRRYLSITRDFFAIKKNQESSYGSTIFFDIFHGFTKSRSRRDYIIQKNTWLSRDAHPKSISSFPMILDFFSMRGKSDTLSCATIVFLCDDSCKRDALICWTIEDICINISFSITKMSQKCIGIYRRESRESLTVLHEVPSIEKPRWLSSGFENKWSFGSKFQDTILYTVGDKFTFYNWEHRWIFIL